MKVEGANGWLSLAGTNFCIKPYGFSFNKGLLYLPEDKTISLGSGYELAFRKSKFVSGTQYVDTSDKVSNTFVMWSQEKGLEKVVVGGELKFSQSALVSVDSDGKRTYEPLKLGITFNFKDWNDWIADITPSSDFEFRDLPGFVIKATSGLYYDHSDLRNPTVLKESDFPKIYKDNNWSRGNDYVGIFMKSLRMKLPKDMVGTGGANIDFGFENMFIDKHGVSTIISANNILTAGSIGGWAFSINSIYLGIEANNFVKDIGMKGILGFPISDDQLNYECHLNTESDKVNYSFSIKPPSNGLNIKMWAAIFKLNPESAFTLYNDAKGTAVMTELSGKLDISFKDPVDLSFTAVSVQGFKLGNRQQDGKEGFYFDAGHIEFGSGSNDGTKTSMNYDHEDFFGDRIYYAGSNGPSVDEYYAVSVSEPQPQKKINSFPITVESFEKVVDFAGGNNLRIGFKFDLGVDLAFGSSIGLAGSTTLVLTGLVDTKNFKPAGVEVPNIEKVTIYGSFGNMVTVDASLEFINDGTRGKGVDGSGKVSFMPGIEVDARVLFGTAPSGYTYYGFGAAVYNYATGLIPLGPVIITGFGGGYFHNMKMVEIPKDNLKNLPATGISAVNVVPTKGASVFLANVGLMLINATVMTAKIELKGEIQSGSLTKLALVGEGVVFSDGQPSSKGIIDVNVNIVYDFVHDAFDMYFGVNANLFTGSVTVPIWIHSGYRGTVPANEDIAAKKARQKEKDNFTFFLYIGNPNEGTRSLITEKEGQIYSKVRIVLMDLKIWPVKAYLGGDAYFCIGNELPPFPDLPPVIANFLGGNSAKKGSDNMVNNLIRGNSHTGPSGFMLGASVTGSIDVDLIIIRAYASATIGFDVALVHTTGGCGKQSQIGLDGWYAVGQVYAYLKMGVDLHIDVGLFSGDITLASVQVGAALMGGMPSPTWLNGRVRVVGKALGGLVSINKSFTIEIGDKCMPDLDPLANIKLIEEVGPAKENVNVFDKPYALFNLPMDKSDFTFTVMDENGKSKIRTYRFFIESYNITTNKGAVDQGEIIFTEKGYFATFYTDTALLGKAKYTIELTCKAQEYVNKVWGDPVNSKGVKEKKIQTEKITFTTDKRPNVLSEKHVVVNYPLTGQQYFLKNEFKGKKGMVVINQYLSDYLKLEGVSKPLQKVIFVPQDGGQKIESTFELATSSGNYRFEFPIPNSLKNSTTYLLYFTLEASTGSIKILNIASQNLYSKNVSIPKGMNESDFGSSIKQVNDPVNGEIIDESKIESGINKSKREIKIYLPAKGRVVYTTIFRTSKYNTIAEKLASFGKSFERGEDQKTGYAYDGIDRTEWKSFYLTTEKGGEKFDEYEIIGMSKKIGEGNSAFSYFIPPLLNAEFVFDKSLYNDKEMDKLYSLWPMLNLTINNYELEFFHLYARSAFHRPDYSVGLINSPSAKLLNMETYLSGRMYFGFDKNNIDYLKIYYDRDRFFINDLALLKGAYYYVSFIGQPTFDVRYSNMNNSKGKDNYTKSFYNFLNDNYILYVSSTGRIKIKEGKELEFWLNKSGEKIKNMVIDIDYRLIDGLKQRKIQFNYGFDLYRFSSLNNTESKAKVYLLPLDLHQTSFYIPFKMPKIDVPKNTKINTTTIQPFTIKYN